MNFKNVGEIIALSQQNIKYVGKNQGIIKAISNNIKFPFAKNKNSIRQYRDS